MGRVEILDKAKSDIVEVLRQRCVEDHYAIEYYSNTTKPANCIIVRLMYERATTAQTERTAENKKEITGYTEVPDCMIEIIPIRQIDEVIVGNDKKGTRVMVNDGIEVNIVEIIPMDQSMLAVEAIQEVIKSFRCQFGEAKPKEEKTGPTVIPAQ